MDGGVGDYTSLVLDDMDGQPRVALLDVGADEFSNASIVRKPLKNGDVGPAWLIGSRWHRLFCGTGDSGRGLLGDS